MEEFQAMEEDENLVEVAPRTIRSLPQIHFSNTPMLSSILKAQRTPKPSVKKTTADNLRPFQPRHPSSPRHRRSHTPQTPTHALISRPYRKHSDHGPRWQPTSASKQRFRAPQCPNQTLPSSRWAIRTAPILPPSPRTATRLNPNSLESPANSPPGPIIDSEYVRSTGSASSLAMSTNATQSRTPSPRTLAANNEEESMRGPSLSKQEIKAWADQVPEVKLGHRVSRSV